MPSTIKMIKRFDYSASGVFNSALNVALSESAPATHIQLDCIHLDYIDSAGIGLLVMAHKKALSQGVSMVLIHVKPSVKEVLFLANLQKLISIQ